MFHFEVEDSTTEVRPLASLSDRHTVAVRLGKVARPAPFGNDRHRLMACHLVSVPKFISGLRKLITVAELLAPCVCTSARNPVAFS